MKSKEEISEIANNKYPYNPFENQFFPGTHQSKISGYISGYIDCQSYIKDLLLTISESDNPLESIKNFLKES
jgi:hypothetical protein